MNWTFWDDKPAWKNVTLGTREERKAKMADAEVRATLRGQWDRGERPILGGMLVKHTGRPDLQRYCGQTAEQIAQDEGKHVVDALFDLVVADDLHTELLGPVSRDQPEYVAEITKSPYTLAGVSDGGAHMQMIPTGAYPTELLTWIVRDEGRVSLEEMHYKLSCLPAFVGGVRDRGFLREGAAADIVVYDLDELSMGSIEVAHDLPGNEWRRIQKPDGYRWIVVNGQVTSEDGTPDRRHPWGNSCATGRVSGSTRGRRAGSLERKTGFEPATLSLARRCSTTEPLPLDRKAVQGMRDPVRPSNLF